jgi:hypothetical protein
MPFGELVTSLRADLVQYERDLNAAYAKAEAWSKKVEKLQSRLSGSGAGGMGGGGDVDANFRRIESARRAAEAEQRRFAASQAAAERDNAKIGSDTMRGRMNDLKQQILLKRELASQDKATAADELKNSLVAMRAKNADVQQQLAFRRDLKRQDDQAAADELRAKSASVKQQMIFKRELARQDKDAAQDAIRNAREEMAAKNANLKQQVLLKRELERLDKVDAQKARQTQQDEIRIARVTRVREEFERSNNVVARMDRAVQMLDKNSLQNMLGTVKNIARAFGAFGAFGIAGVVAVISKLGIEQNQIYQRQLTTMASILAMTTRVKDSQGTTVVGQRAHNAQLQEAGRLYSLIRREAASTILTGQELFGAVSANLGLGASAGLKPEQTVEVSKQITQLAKASGLSGERQFAQETRALLTGQGLQSGTVARILGIFSKKQVEQHIQKGDLFEYIMERVNKAEPHLKRFKASFDGVMTTLTTKAQDLSRLAFEKFFEKLTRRIGELNKVLTQERLESWAEKISDGLLKVFDAIDGFVSGGGFQKLLDFFNYLMNNGSKLIAIFAAMKGALAIGGAAAGVRDFQRNQATLAAQRLAMAQQVGGVAASGATLAGGATGVGATATTAAGGLTSLASALSILSAALAGFAVGTVAYEGLKELTGAGKAERQEAASLANLQKMRSDPRTAGGAELSRRKARTKLLADQLQQSYLGQGETQSPGLAAAGALFPALGVAGALVGKGKELLGFGAEPAREDMSPAALQKRYDAAVFAEAELQKKLLAERNKVADDNLQFESLESEKNARLRRQAANKERVEFGLHVAKLREDKVHEINAQAQLDAIEARKTLQLDELEGEDRIAATKKFNIIAGEIERKRIEDIRDYRAQQLIDYKQTLAQQTGLTRQALDADYAATIKSIEDKKYPIEKENQLKTAAAANQGRKLRDLRDQEAIQERQAEVDATGNVLAQLDLQFAGKAVEVRKEVEATKTGRAAEEEIQRRFHLLQVQRLRERGILISETEDKARDLARRSVTTERERAEAIKRFTREVGDLQKQTAKELRDLAREQADSERDLARARRAGLFDEQKMGRKASTTPGSVALGGGLGRGTGVFQPGTIGTEGTNFALQDEAGDILHRFGIDEEVRRKLIGQHGEQLGGAMASRQIRQLRDTFAGGDVEGGLGQLGTLGIQPRRNFSEAAHDLGARSLANQEEGARLSDDEAREQLKQQREDMGRTVEDVQRRIQELDERQAEVTLSYKETIQKLHVDFNDAILKNADDMKSLSQEVVRFMETLKASGIAIRNDFMQSLRQAAGGPQTQNAAERAAQAQGGTVYNLIFNAESVKLDAKGQEAMRALADVLDQQRLRTAPARK